MNIIFALIITAAVCLIFAAADTLFSFGMYLVYLYDGGTKSYKWYRNLMNNCTIEW